MNDFYKHAIQCGCTDYSNRFGIVRMPPGYVCMLDPDDMFFFWIRLSDGMESVTSWNRWAVYRGAVADSKKERKEDVS